MNSHLAWIWMWFIVGQTLNILKRAYFKVTGPDNMVSGYGAFFAANWPVLIFRGFAGACIYWLTFYPQTLGIVAHWFGWSTAISNLPQIAPVALLAGIGSDAALDWIATKIPFLKGQLPSFGAGVKTTTVEKKTEQVTVTTPLINEHELNSDTMPNVGNPNYLDESPDTKTVTKEKI